MQIIWSVKNKCTSELTLPKAFTDKMTFLSSTEVTKKKVQRSPQCINTAPYVPSCYWKPSPWSQIIYAQNNEHKPENNFLLTSENTAAFTLVEDFKIQVKGNYHWVNHTKNMIIPEKKWTQLLIIQLEKEVL